MAYISAINDYGFSDPNIIYFTIIDRSIPDSSSEPDKANLGDVNSDGKIDVEDAVIVIGHVNGNKALTDDETSRADIDANSVIDIEDAVAIIAHVNGVKAIGS